MILSGLSLNYIVARVARQHGEEAQRTHSGFTSAATKATARYVRRHLASYKGDRGTTRCDDDCGIYYTNFEMRFPVVAFD
jgi:hypothetical protein